MEITGFEQGLTRSCFNGVITGLYRVLELTGLSRGYSEFHGI